MSKETLARADLVRLLAQAAESGYLGLFVGTGMSRDLTANTAPSFRELLESLPGELLASPLNLLSDEELRHRSFPQIASILLERYRLQYGYTQLEAGLRFREAIARICNFPPQAEAQTRYREVLRRVRPAWIITTNYDSLLEGLVDEHESIVANQPIAPRSDRVPVLHLHGHRLEPSTIRVTEEDYAEILGRLDYQRLRLPLLFAESATLMLGYSLSDLNVRAAIEWSYSFGRDHGLRLSPHQGLVVQVLYKPGEIEPETYRGPAGQIVVESESILIFLEELAAECERLRSKIAKFNSRLREFSIGGTANLSTDANAETEFLKLVKSGFGLGRVSEILICVDHQLALVWSKAREYYGWEFYKQYVSLLIKILTRLPAGADVPAVLGYFADAFETVSWFLDPTERTGTAWGATRLWKSRGGEIPRQFREQLREYAQRHNRAGLARMLGLVNGREG